MSAENKQPARQSWATPDQVAEWLQVSTVYLRKLRHKGRGPRYLKEGHTIRYLWSDVHSWCKDRFEADLG